MNDHSDRNPEAPSAAEVRRIDHAVAQFRAAWDSGTRPRIEDYLADTGDAPRAELLMRLLAEEVACRVRIGETPAAEEYEQRLPADAETVREAFNRSTPFPAKPSEQNTHSHQQPVVEETETQAWEPPPAKPTAEPGRPEFIGRYKVVGVLGHGGFGTVYRARDEQLQRDVAIKVWRQDRFAGDEAVEQLLQEARHVARLDEHPSIVGVHDVGRQEDGSAFVVFQYIEGHSLAEELKSHPLPPDRVWDVMIQVTSAIQHAHATGLVHRDLKPANVLLDKDGNARVADFGLAIDDQSQRLHAGEVSGTPAYMSPEQVRGEAHRLDGRTDLWALGVMLYEMLVHRRPFQGQTRQEVFDEILHRDPKPPRQLDPQLPADLERICLKCLSKDATQRYLTAADLAKDLRHAHQAPERRKRRMMTIASVVAAGLLILAAFWGYLTQPGVQPVISVQPGAGLVIRHRATLRGHSDAVWSVAFSPDDRTLASAGVDRTIKLWDVVAGHETLQLTGHRSEVRQVAFSPDGLSLASASGDRSIAVWDRETGELKHQITGHEGDVRSVTFLPAGNQLVSGSVDRTIRFWEVESGSQQQEIATHRAAVQSVICSRDGRTLASASDDRTIQLRSVETGELLLTLTGHTDGVVQVAFSPDGQRLVSTSWDKTIRIWDVASGKLLRTIEEPASAVRSVAFSPDGRRLASGGEDHTIRLWDAETGVELATLRGHKGSVTSVAFSSDGRILASASADKTVMMWELEEADPAKPVDRPPVAATGRQPAKDQPAGAKPSVAELERGKQPAQAAVEPTPLPASATPSKIASKQPQEPPSVGPTTVAKVPEVTSQEPPAADRALEPKPTEWITIEIKRELLGWKAYGSGNWSVEAGGVLKGEGTGGWLGTDQDYDDFELTLEFRLGKDSNSGIVLRAWPNGQPDGRDFLKIQLLDDTSPKFAAAGPTERTAAVFKAVAPSPPVRGGPGEWHAITIRAEGPNIKVQYDSQAVVDMNLEKADAEIEGHRRTSGRIGLQALSGTVEFRNIAIRRLVRPQPAVASPAPPLAIAPFDAATARKHQEAWAKHLGVPVEMTNSIGVRFVLIPPGEFDMGSTEAEVAKLLEVAKATNPPSWYIERLPSEAPKHRVRITKPFYLSASEMTQAQYERVMGSNPSKFKEDTTCPVEMVNWDEASAFCRKLGELPEERPAQRAYRLPTEAEWEYGCRAGTTATWYSGDEETGLKEVAWYSGNAGGKTHPVCEKRPNAWGLYDMHGNVWEWCQEWWAADYYGASPLDDPTGPAGGSYRVRRGGGWGFDASYSRASGRGGSDPGGRRDDLGFRLARAVSLSDSESASAQKSIAEPPQSKDSPLEQPSAPATPPSAKPVPPWILPAGSPPPAVAPFDAAKAKEHQVAWAEHLGVPVEFENSIGMKFALIPPGEFDMGSTEAEVAKLLEEARASNQSSWYIDRLLAEAPRHRVRITKAFRLAVTEVTQEQYEQVMGSNPSRFKEDANCPVEQVSWDEASTFCRKLGELPEERLGQRAYRLPTEAEWEQACRCGTTTTWYSGDDEAGLKEIAWYNANSGDKTHPVGQKKPNAWGLYDMHGNVHEWCQDWWKRDYTTTVVSDPTGPATGSHRVLRGGGWSGTAWLCRSASRSSSTPDDRYYSLGFRLASSSVDQSGR